MGKRGQVEEAKREYLKPPEILPEGVFAFPENFFTNFADYAVLISAKQVAVNINETYPVVTANVTFNKNTGGQIQVLFKFVCSKDGSYILGGYDKQFLPNSSPWDKGTTQPSY
jgi:hypothetical protein